MRYYKTDPFYLSGAWRKKRKEVLRNQNHECQYCKARGLYAKATHVHHVYTRDKYPQYELDEYVRQVDGTTRRNLTACCRACHETIGHPERMRNGEKKSPVTEERW